MAKSKKAMIGISEDNLDKVAEILSRFLADEFVLQLKTRNAHWNIEGENFSAFHKFFDGQYEELSIIIDDVAERIRSLGRYAPAKLRIYLQLTHLTEELGGHNDSLSYIRELRIDHESIIIHLRENINHIANELHDVGTSDYLTGLLTTHEKMAWMLRAHVPQSMESP